MVGPLFIGCPRLKTGNVPEGEGKELAHIKAEKEILHWQPLLETGHTTQSKATEDQKGHLKTSNLSMNHCPSGGTCDWRNGHSKSRRGTHRQQQTLCPLESL